VTRAEFIFELHKRLSGLPKADVEERLAFYGEMIDDRIEGGLTEEEAVSDIGSVDEIAEQIIGDIPLLRIARGRMKPNRRLSALEIVLLVLGSPIWISLIAAAFSCVLSVYVVLWSGIISAWAVFVSTAAVLPCALISGVINFFSGNAPFGFILIGVGVLCAGLSVFLFFGCIKATRAIIRLTGRIALGIKKCFVKKEGI